MNGPFTILGVLAFSVAVGSYFVYKMSAHLMELRPEERRSCIEESRQNSTLEEDLEDVVGCLPLVGIKEILYDYLMYDKQIASTYTFIDDQKAFIIQELQRIPHTNILSVCLQDMGFRIDHWHSEVAKFWKSLPRFERSEPGIASGGLTVMIQKMLQALPSEELHILLWAKARYSENFKFLITLLSSPMFIDMCQEISQNSSLRRHFYWAMEEEIEVTFAVELAYALYTYFTKGLGHLSSQ